MYGICAEIEVEKRRLAVGFIEPKGLVFNIQRFSIHDGPGIRTTVFLKGCPLRCLWCHNPEGYETLPEILVVESRCIGCGACQEACPHGLAGQDTSGEDSKQCTLCALCVEACPTGARQMAGTSLSVNELLAQVLKDRIFYEDSGGGVTFSGGEPLYQFSFLRSALEAIRNRGLHTAVDTSGFCRQDDLLEISAFTDLFLFDLKLMDEEAHIRYTGLSNRPILENLTILAQRHSTIWIRIPIIPGVNDNPEEIHAIAEFVASLPDIAQVNLLPYHAIGVQKFQRVGRSYVLENMYPPSQEHLETLALPFQTAGILTKIGG